MGIRTSRWATHGLLVCLLAAGSATPCPGETKRGWSKLWKVSAVVLAAVNIADVSTSMGHYEVNPLLQNGQGRFSAGRAVTVKSAASGGMLLMQMLLLKHMPDQRLDKPAALLNFAAAAAVGATAFRNSTIR